MSDVFISYSRKDIAFARILNDMLQAKSLDSWIDWQDILPSDNWLAEVYAAIEAADTFVFLVSQTSIASEICSKELAHAIQNHKRLVPIAVQDVDPKVTPPAVSVLNWIFFREGQDDFQKSFETLMQAVQTDLDWVKMHTRLQVRALEWEKRNRNTSLLLRGQDLQDAEQQLAHAGVEKNPQPTDLQRQYVLASRSVETQRQRTTLRASLGALGIISICLVIAIVLGVLAFRAQRTAEANLARSESLRLTAEAENILSQPNGNAETAALFSIRALQGGYLPQADASLLKSLPRLYALHIFNSTSIVISVAFSPDGKLVLIGNEDGTAKLWDAATGAEVRTFYGHTDWILSVAFSPDGKVVLTGSMDGTAKLWDAATGSELRTFSGHTSMVYSAAFSPDGKYVLTGSRYGTAKLWDAATGAEVRTFSGHTGGILSVAFSPDGKYVLTRSDDNTAKLWDADTVAEVRTFNGHMLGFLSVVFSPDGKVVLTGNEDGTAKLWDLATGAEGRSLNGYTGWINSVAFSL